ncbi:MAG: D-2-hydroxyacid dehydrogenase [Verrucomicrobiota bacterium]
MKLPIVVLDSFTTSPLAIDETHPEHPSWHTLAALGDLTLHHRTSAEQLIERVGKSPVIFTNKVVLSAETLQALPDLRYVGLMSTGTNVIDLGVARDLGITVTNVPAYSTASVAQHTIALLLEMAGNVSAHAELAHSGKWSAQSDFSVRAGPMIELAGKKFGIVGCGDIGQATARIAVALGMEILVYSRSRRETDFPCRWMDKEEFLHSADVVSLHCPLTPETEEWINRTTLSQMKPGAFLINTGRGHLVDEQAVADALHSGHLGGYGADVTKEEPPSPNNPLFGVSGSLITPHVAWANTEARARLIATLAKNLEAFLNGNPQNVV